jgi:hypothetical protein
VRVGSKPVISEARAGAHSGLGVYAFSKTTPVFARLSIVGVFVTSWPYTRRKGADSWSTITSRMCGRSSIGG